MNQKSNSFNVLNHGDFWSNNFMFNYLPTGELNKVLFVDYQFCKWGSPAEDLLLFITVSAAQDIIVKEFDYFISFYHKHLIDCLTALGYKRPLPKLRDLHKDLLDQNNSFYGEICFLLFYYEMLLSFIFLAAFFACYNHLPMVKLPSDKDNSLARHCRDDEIGREFRMKSYTNPRYIEAIKQLFPFYSNKGVFNFSDYN